MEVDGVLRSDLGCSQLQQSMVEDAPEATGG